MVKGLRIRGEGIRGAAFAEFGGDSDADTGAESGGTVHAGGREGAAEDGDTG